MGSAGTAFQLSQLAPRSPLRLHKPPRPPQVQRLVMQLRLRINNGKLVSTEKGRPPFPRRPLVPWHVESDGTWSVPDRHARAENLTSPPQGSSSSRKLFAVLRVVVAGRKVGVGQVVEPEGRPVVDFGRAERLRSEPYLLLTKRLRGALCSRSQASEPR